VVDRSAFSRAGQSRALAQPLIGSGRSSTLSFSDSPYSQAEPGSGPPTFSHPKPRSLAVIHYCQNFKLQPHLTQHTSPQFPLTTTNHFHDFLSYHSRTVSQIHLSAWLTSALSVWKTLTSFPTQVFTMIFEMREEWRDRPKTCQHPIPAQRTPNNLLLSLNPAVMFCTTSV
jgi:hypothetical protein